MSDATPNQDETLADLPEKRSDPSIETLISDKGMRGVPTQIGHYRIKQILASGGMGTVYLAVQEHPKRTVALKLMKQGIVNADTLRRFEFESQVLARLRHPNIAQIFEAGTYDDGNGSVPFFAMEYVPNARPISTYTKGRTLDIRLILEIFIKVCDAVHHGHQKGVIHRDLKPDNILVDSNGEPKIIDFGVARTTESDMTITTLQTNVGQLVGTVQYMSPEQCDADPHDLDTRSDVYALGVVLYELICGKLPYDVSQVQIFEAARLVKEAQPLRPSTINRMLRGDLETITLKAIEKDRDRRYQSAQHLAHDLQRFLNNEPIDARPPSMVYQISMFARRNRAAFASAVVIVLALVVATVVSIAFGVSSTRAHRVAKEAELEALNQRDEAIQARLETQQAKLESDRQRDAALAAEALAAQQSYIVNVAAASEALDKGDVEIASRRLAQSPERLRNWEWHYLSNLADQSILTFAKQSDQITSISFSVDGTRLASGSTDGTIKVFNSATGEEVAQIGDYESPVFAVACSPNGVHLASASTDMSVRIWNILTGRELITLDGHDGVITSIAYSRDGGRLVSGSTDLTMRLWDTRTGESLAVMTLEDASFDCVAISPDNARLASGSDDGLVRIWDASEGTMLQAFDAAAGFINAVAFSPDRNRLAVATENHGVLLWDLNNQSDVVMLEGHEGNVTGVAFSPDGAWIVSSAEDRTLRVWDVETATERMTYHGHTGAVSCVAVSPDGRRIATGSEDASIRLWDAGLYQFIKRPQPDSRTRTEAMSVVAFNPHGVWGAGGRQDGSVEFWDVLTGRVLGLVKVHDGPIRCLEFNADGTVMVSASDDTSIKVWNAATVEVTKTLEGHTRRVSALAFSSNESELISVSWDGTIRRWELATGDEVWKMTIENASLNDIAIDPQTGQYACATASGLIVIIDPRTSDVIEELTGHDGPVTSLVYRRDGRQLVSSSSDSTIRCWDTETWSNVTTLQSHALAVSRVLLTPDDSRIISGSFDASIRIWDAHSGEEIGSLPGRHGPILSLAISADGTQVASSTTNGILELRDSQSRVLRFQERLDAELVVFSARRLVDEIVNEGLTLAEAAQRIRLDETIGEALRDASFNRIIQLSIRAQTHDP